MSRVGKRPIAVPKGATVQVEGSRVSVKGPRGQLDRTLHPDMKIQLDGDTLTVTRPSDAKVHRELHGLTRTLINNMVEGVTTGFTKRLELQGVGYKAEEIPSGVRLVVGLSHPVEYQAPKGVKISVDGNTIVQVEGADKERVGQVAAELRGVRPPEPYKGKGIRYVGEHVRRKAGKTGAKA